MDESCPYQLVECDDGFQVVDGELVILTCRDRHSADHYLALLERAFARGYRLGYRHARNA